MTKETKRIAIYGKNPTHPVLIACGKCFHQIEESDNYCWYCGCMIMQEPMATDLDELNGALFRINKEI